MSDATPNPGSDAAIKRGCTCPVMDNCHGRGAYGMAGQYWITAGCPLHNPRKDTDDNDA